MRSVARWCYQHRFLVLGAWIVVLFATFFGASSTGSNYAAGTQLSGTPSARAAALLQRAAPSVAGDTETIVFETKTGHVTDPAVRAQIQQMLAKVGHLQYVSGITSPYTAAGAKQVSATGTIAFAQVNFTKADSAIPAGEATQLVNLARAPNSPSGAGGGGAGGVRVPVAGRDGAAGGAEPVPGRARSDKRRSAC
jgi:putative drug exporter of the RND superfamily